MAGLTTIGTLASLAGSLISAGAQSKASGIQAQAYTANALAQQQALDYQAAQIDIQANEERAAAQQQAGEYRRATMLALSSLQNRAAASGFSAGDEGTLDIADEIAQYGTYQEQVANYGGASRMDALRAEAEGRRLSGRAAVQGGMYAAQGARAAGRGAALGTILGGISTFASNFGGIPYKSNSYSFDYS